MGECDSRNNAVGNNIQQIQIDKMNKRILKIKIGMKKKH